MTICPKRDDLILKRTYCKDSRGALDRPRIVEQRTNRAGEIFSAGDFGDPVNLVSAWFADSAEAVFLRAGEPLSAERRGESARSGAAHSW